MEAVHNINYEGIDLEICGEYEKPDNTTGYKGGFSCYLVLLNGNDISWMLNDKTLERITDLVVEQNY